MKSKNLWILAGAPGSGKSFWAKQQGLPIVSRDEIRFSLLSDKEDYFSHETEVYDRYVNEINKTLNEKGKVIADATHLNWSSRRKLLERIKDKDNTQIGIIWFDTKLSTCLERNAIREGRSHVPATAVKNMYNARQYPLNDPREYEYIIDVDELGRKVGVTLGRGADLDYLRLAFQP